MANTAIEPVGVAKAKPKITADATLLIDQNAQFNDAPKYHNSIAYNVHVVFKLSNIE